MSLHYVYIDAMDTEKRYEYRKMFAVSEGHRVILNLPVDLVRDYWELIPGDKVLVTVDKNLAYRVRPMK